VPERIDFKLAVPIYRWLHGLAPRYLSDYIQRVAHFNRRLRSSSSSQLVIRRTRLSTVEQGRIKTLGAPCQSEWLRTEVSAYRAQEICQALDIR